MVRGIIQAHDGTISVYSEPGQGSTFTVFFPLLARKTPVQAMESVPKAIPNGSERIMLVDDEQDILHVLSELLRLHGYTVATFSDSREALHHFRQNRHAYDMVITDMTMPGLTGDILGKKLMFSRPDLPVILCTGFSKGIGRKQSLEEGFAAYLEKPIEVENLLRTVRRVFDVDSERLSGE